MQNRFLKFPFLSASVDDSLKRNKNVRFETKTH